MPEYTQGNPYDRESPAARMVRMEERIDMMQRVIADISVAVRTLADQHAITQRNAERIKLVEADLRGVSDAVREVQETVTAIKVRVLGSTAAIAIILVALEWWLRLTGG